jgi:RES domain-containing protein
VITAWRIVKAEYVRDAFSGEGALLYAGRWHSAGTRVVYTAESPSLATLETLVHLRRRNQLPAYHLVPCSFRDALVHEVDASTLPADWFAPISPSSLRTYGDSWARERISAVLRVPSAITQIEHNYLLNAEHPDFAAIEIGESRPFRFDLRLLV